MPPRAVRSKESRLLHIASETLQDDGAYISLGKVTTGLKRHLVFVCPAVQHVRDKYSHLFTPRRPTMRQFMWQDDTVSVVRFVAECLDILQSTVTASHQP